MTSECPADPTRRELSLRFVGGGRLEGLLGHAGPAFLTTPTLLPLPNGTVTRIVLRGSVAGITPAARIAWLREWRRILAAGGELDLREARLDEEVLEEAAASGLSAADDPWRWNKLRPAIRSGRSLVSVLIPAFNPRFFEASLRSALDQSHESLEIVIGDDRPDEAIEDIVAPYARRDPRIRYVRNPQRLGGRANYIELFSSARGDYVKFLNDDDLLRPRCVELMARCLDRHPEVTLVTSHRLPIDAHGKPLPDLPATRRPFPEDRRVEGSSLIEEVLLRQLNFIGEPTTAMFRRADAAGNQPHLLSFAGRPGAGNNDVTLWVSLLARGEAIYLARSLSCFRQHDEQWQRDPEGRARSLRGWAQLDEDARRSGFCRPDSPSIARSVELWPRPWWPAEGIRLMQACDAALLRGDLAGARETLERAAELLDGDADVEQVRGKLLLAMGRPAEALPFFERAIGAAVDPVAPRVGLAAAWIELDALQPAEDRLREALEQDPSSEEARRLLAAVVCRRRPELAPSGSSRLHGAFDVPADGAETGRRLQVRGWMIAGPDASRKLPQLEIRIDDRIVESRIVRVARPDVAAELPELGLLEPFPGFETVVPTEGLAHGEHELTCAARDGRGARVVASTCFRVKPKEDEQVA